MESVFDIQYISCDLFMSAIIWFIFLLKKKVRKINTAKFNAIVYCVPATERSIYCIYKLFFVCVCLSFFIFCQLYLIWIYSIYIVCLRVRVRVLMCCMSRYSQFWYNILIVLLGNNLSQLSKTSKQIHVQLLRYAVWWWWWWCYAWIC